MNQKVKDNTINNYKFEQAFSELEKIVNSLENEEHALNEALDLYEKGQALAEHCISLLEEAELRVEQLTEGRRSPYTE